MTILKDEEVDAVPLAVVTVITPVVAPEGTITVNSVLVAMLTVAATPLNVTVFPMAVVLKFSPLIMTVEPIVLLTGVKPVIVGVKLSVSLDFLQDEKARKVRRIIVRYFIQVD